MELPTIDQAFLAAKNFVYEFLPGNASERLLVLRGIRLAPGRYNHEVVDVLVKIPPGYPVTLLDMFWVFPALRYADGRTPQAADTYESHEGRSWQRFSRHLPPGSWRPGIDSLRTFLPRVLAELTQS